ncbi:MAG: alpha/beta fold hydrolase [Rhodobacterales bacterium]|nr:alpha/beta fold hydrolase [Rhodobacterales bacterium]
MALDHAEIRSDLSLAFEHLGGDGSPVLLIMGLGSQMLLWHDQLCEQLRNAGHEVVRFDNRDVGLSTYMDHLKAPSLRRIATMGAIGADPGAPYLLRDMAEDAVLLMNHLGWSKAHVIGASMGGMIAQELAAGWPDRVHSLTSIMSSARPTIPSPRGIKALFKRPGVGKEAYVNHFVQVFLSIGGPGMQNDRDRLVSVAERCYQRGSSATGFRRQLAAIIAAGDRRRHLSGIRAPTLVLHGDQDPLVPLSAGRQTARAIGSSRLHIIPGMGHSMSSTVLPLLIEQITEHTRNSA